tara:strand:+ start:291 stop:617 length:327 start_codon:yes stop_codon:yes gene_type:complete
LISLSLSACAPTPQQWFKRSQQAYQQQNYGTAFAYAQFAARQGNVKAAYALGYLYYYGTGTEANPVLARRWIQRAAERGYRPAKNALTVLYNQATVAPHQERIPVPNA